MTLNDPYSLTLPVDPLDVLEKTYSDTPPYSSWNDDVLQVSQEAASLLKEVVQIGTGKSKTEQIVTSDSGNSLSEQA